MLAPFKLQFISDAFLRFNPSKLAFFRFSLLKNSPSSGMLWVMQCSKASAVEVCSPLYNGS